jgi:hypothetical protein
MLMSTACSPADDEMPGPGTATWDAAVLAGVDASTGPSALGGGTAMAGGSTAGGGTPGGLAGGGVIGATAGGAMSGGGGTSGAAGGGSAGATAGGGAQPMPDAGPTIDSGPPVLTLPTSSVACGGSTCDGLSNVCCESWSAGTGFSNQQMCSTREACRQAFPFDIFNPDSNRVVTHSCDGNEDCSASQVCCFYAEGRPICDALDPATCLANLTGPGGSRICAEETACKQDALQFVAEGLPLGVLSCNDNGDCQARPGTSCQPEQDNTVTTGKGVMARNYVKVCR